MKARKGSTVALAALAAAATVFFILSISTLLRVETKHVIHLKQLNRTSRLAETGMNLALGRLAIDPTLLFAGPIRATIDDGETETRTKSVVHPTQGSCYYMITSATRTTNGKTIVSRLHTYAKVSNASDYFAAINSTVTVASGINAGTGKLYGPVLKFTTPAVGTRFLAAQFVAPTQGGGVEPALTSAEYAVGKIEIAQPTAGPYAHKPEMLPAPILFPQVLDSDLVRYKELARILIRDGFGNLIPNPNVATEAHQECDFRRDLYKNAARTHIFPPGYKGAAAHAFDGYPLHRSGPISASTNPNDDHVYYCDDPAGMFIQGYVHGQVLFVSEGPIFISSHVYSADEFYIETATAEDFLTGPQGGGLQISSSTANQAVLITRGTVYIDNTFWPQPDGLPVSITTQTIQALIMAPNGFLQAVPYSWDLTNTVHSKLRLEFKGSMILQEIGTSPTLTYVFNNPGRNKYEYMTSLKTYPPPYVPALASIIAVFDEFIGEP